MRVLMAKSNFKRPASASLSFLAGCSASTLGLEEACKQSMNFLLHCNTEVLYIELDLKFEGAMGISPAIACEHRGNMDIAVEVDPEVGVVDMQVLSS